MGSSMLQGFVDVHGGRAQYCSKRVLDITLVDTYKAVCLLLEIAADKATTGSLTVDDWRNEFGTPILGMTGHYCDDEWRIRSVPIASLNLGSARKTGAQLCPIIEEGLSQNPIVGSDKISVFTGTSDNEAAAALSVDLLTNFVRSVRCFVHSLALCVKDVFVGDSTWKIYLDQVNDVATYFSQHQEASQLLAEEQFGNGLTQDRIQRLKHDIPTRWHSRLAAMLVYLTQSKAVASIAQKLDIPPSVLPPFSGDEEDLLAEFVTVLAEVRRVARELEAVRKVTLSRAPRYLRELCKTLLIMSGSVSTLPRRATNRRQSIADIEDDAIPVNVLAVRPSVAEADKSRNEARQQRPANEELKLLAKRLAEAIKRRFECYWHVVSSKAALWRPYGRNDDTDINGDGGSEGEERPDRRMHEPRRVLLLHVAAILDVNECSLDFLDVSNTE